MTPKTPQDIIRQKGVEKLSMITCYDYSFARAIAGKVDMLLVGDSLGNVVLGYNRTTFVTMDDILRHLGAVRRGAPEQFIVADLPAGSYDTAEEAIANAKRLIDGGANAVKPEGKPQVIGALTAAGFAVMGHLGYLPQTAEKFQVVGREKKEAAFLLAESKKIQDAGAFGLVLECVPTPLAKKITLQLDIPTIGIGSGAECDGQVLVLYGMLGLFNDFRPKFVRRYLNLAELVAKAIDDYTTDIKNKDFPSENEEYF